MRYIECFMVDAQQSTVRLVCEADAMIGESPATFSDRVRWTDPVSRRLLSAALGGSRESIAKAASVWPLAVLPDRALAGSLEDRLCTLGRRGEIYTGVGLGANAVLRHAVKS